MVFALLCAYYLLCVCLVFSSTWFYECKFLCLNLIQNQRKKWLSSTLIGFASVVVKQLKLNYDMIFESCALNLFCLVLSNKKKSYLSKYLITLVMLQLQIDCRNFGLNNVAEKWDCVQSCTRNALLKVSFG